MRHGSDRGDQLYRIRHTGGESQVRIPHHMVGNGWVYLGEYYFNAGSNSLNGAVVISNLRGTPQGTYAFADGIRFGNGMGSIDRGGGVSDYPREDENCRYWVEAGIGVGQSSTLYNGGSGTHDESDSWNTPPRMSAEMNNTGTVSNMFKRVHIGFHSNATTGNTNTALARGTTALIESSNPTPNQARFAKLCVTEVENDLIALGTPTLEFAWKSRNAQTTSGGYTELSNGLFVNEMDATIVEVAFHDNTNDAPMLRDSKVRAAVAKGVLHGILRYMNEFDANPLVYLPEPPANVRAAGETNGNINLKWAVPVSTGGSGAPTNYVIYRSTNGYGFGNPVSVGNITNYTITDLAADTDYYFQVAAANAGGQSFPSVVVGCRAVTTNTPKVLYVNAFDRFNRTTNLRQDTTRQNWDPPGPSGIIERVWPRSVNAFNYVVPHGKAIATFGMAFDTCQNEAVASGLIVLTNYPIVIWGSGQETTNDETFSATEQTKVSAFLNAGGHLFVSGSDIGLDLDRASGPTAADRTFYNTYLHSDFGSDTNDDANIYTAVAVSGSIFNGRGSAIYDNGTRGIYWVQNPDILTPFGAGATPSLYYSGTTNVAAIQYSSGGAGRVVYFGFPFEAMTNSTRQNEYMADILNFFTPAKILNHPSNLTALRGADVAFNVTASGHAPLAYQWRLNGTNIAGATSTSLSRTNVQTLDAGAYTVVVTNSTGSTTSSIANLNIYPFIDGQPQSQITSSGNTINMTVIAGGSGPFRYQWWKNGASISGATNNPFVLDPVLTADAADTPGYVCVVTNTVGSATSDPATLVVSKGDQTIVFNPIPNKSYGDVFTPSATVASGLPITFSIVSGPATVSGNMVTITDLGTITVRASQPGNIDYNPALDVEQSFSAGKATASVTSDNKFKVYGASVPGLTYTYGGFVNGDNQSVVIGTPTLDTTATTNSTIAGNPYPITIDVSALSAERYNFSPANGTLTVTKAPLTVTANDTNRIYGATNPPFSVAYSGFVLGENESVVSGSPGFTSATTNSPVSGNPHLITPTLGTLTAANYSFSFAPGNLTINKAGLTVQAVNKTKTYGSSNPPLTVTYVGLLNNETAAVISGAPDISTTASTNSTVAGNPYSIALALGTLTATNYDMTNFVNGELTVTRATITATAQNKAKLYGADIPPLTHLYSGFVLGEDAAVISGTPVLNTTASTNSPVSGNPYPITTEVSGLSAANYQFAGANGQLTVLKVPLTVTANDTNRAYAGTNPTFTASHSGFVLGENASFISGAPAFSTTATTNSSVSGSPYAIIPAIGSLSATNYSFSTFVNGNLAVMPVSLTVSADNKIKAYGATNPPFTGNIVGLRNGDNITASYSTVATTNSFIGIYPITPSLNDPTTKLPNYTVTTNNGTLTVNRAPLTANVDNKCRATGATNPLFTGTLVGIQNSDNISATYDTTTTIGSPSASYPITPTFSDPAGKLPNYLVLTNAGTLKVIDLPNITTAPTNQLVNVSDAVMFTADISNNAPFATEPLMLQWKYNDLNIPGATNTVYVVAAASSTNAGTYTIVANNCGGSSSASASLTLIVPLKFVATAISSDQIQMLLQGQPGASYSLEASTNLVDWSSVTNFVMPNGPFEFLDGLTNDHRFYRVKEL